MLQIAMFDFDGVLCDSRASAVEEVEVLRRGDSTFRQLPSPVQDGGFDELYRGELRHALMRFNLDEQASRRFFDAHAAAMRERTASLSAFEGVADILSWLGPARYVVITSAYSTAVVDVLQRAGVSVRKSQVIGHEVRLTKTEKIRGVLQERGLNSSDAVYVGDLESDILYSRKIGVPCIAVAYGYHSEDVLEQSSPDFLCSDVAALHARLESLFA